MKVADLVSILSKMDQSKRVLVAVNPDWPMEYEMAGVSTDGDEAIIVAGPVTGYGSKETWTTMEKADPAYPHEDCTGCKFRVLKVSTHEWKVFEERKDEFGSYDEFIDTIDDCDTEDEAVQYWEQRRREDQRY